MAERHTCCICHREFEGWGNNPAPLPEEDGNPTCCDDCNENFVIPARLMEMGS